MEWESMAFKIKFKIDSAKFSWMGKSKHLWLDLRRDICRDISHVSWIVRHAFVIFLDSFFLYFFYSPYSQKRVKMKDIMKAPFYNLPYGRYSKSHSVFILATPQSNGLFWFLCVLLFQILLSLCFTLNFALFTLHSSYFRVIDCHGLD